MVKSNEHFRNDYANTHKKQHSNSIDYFAKKNPALWSFLKGLLLLLFSLLMTLVFNYINSLGFKIREEVKAEYDSIREKIDEYKEESINILTELFGIEEDLRMYLFSQTDFKELENHQKNINRHKFILILQIN